MINQLGKAGSVQVFGDHKAYGTYASDTIDCVALGKVPVVEVQNGIGAIHAYIERSSDQQNWGRFVNDSNTKARIAEGQTGFLMDSLPVSVQYMRIVFEVERFPQTSTAAIVLH